MLDKYKLQTKLKEWFISVCYEERCPLNMFMFQDCSNSVCVNNRLETATRLYKEDPQFHHRVDSFVSATIDFISKCEQECQQEGG